MYENKSIIQNKTKPLPCLQMYLLVTSNDTALYFCVFIKKNTNQQIQLFPIIVYFCKDHP